MQSIFTYPQLKDIASRKELDKSRQLAKQDTLLPEQALRIVLLRSAQLAGLADIAQLGQCRAEAKIAARLQKTERRVQQKKQAKNLQDKARQMQTALTWLAWFDGSAVPNPGKCQIACVLQAPDGRVFEYTEKLDHGDSSDAEYSALILALKKAQQHQVTDLLVQGDSQVVIHDFNQVKTSVLPRMADYRQQARQFIDAFDQLQLRWVPRHKNSLADALTQIRVQVSPLQGQP
ncbi:ribonuclease HI family protein [Undibacterium sp. TJN19]|uniref:ribonuclease HI family protein n=1 Tax=Undibacterium sp. TJN19 TaxID=3413055 RepID=UPI003BF40487